MQDTTTASSRAPRRTALLVALAGTVGLIAGALAFGGGSSPAGASVGWTSPTLEAPFTDIGAPFQTAQYGIDGEGFVHLRGIVTGTGVPLSRVGGGTGGPWAAPLFTLPCEYTPPAYVGVRIHANEPVHGLEPYDGVLFISTEGVVSIGAFDVPVYPDGAEPTVGDFTASLESITYEPVSSCEETTTTVGE